MGIFDKQTEHEYLAYSVELFEGMPPLVQQTVAGAVMQNRNIGKDIIANLVNGILWKSRGLYNFALSESFPWDLPNGTDTNVTGSKSDTVKACIQSDVGQPVYMGHINVLTEPNGTFTYTAQYWFIDEVGNTVGEVQTWTYNTGTGTYPTLEITGSNQNTPYYPIIPIRQGDTYLGDDIGDTYYSAIKGALRYLGIKSSDLYDGLKESEAENEESAPNDIYVLLGVSVSHSSQRTKEYLFRFFKKMLGTSQITEADFDYWVENQRDSITPPQNTLTVTESSYHQELSWDYITRSINTGSIGTKGTYTCTYEKNTDDEYINDNYTYIASGIRLQYQLSDTQYEEYVVHGLTCKMNVVNKEWIGITLKDAFENPNDPEDGKAFIIPLRRDICNDMGNIRAHDLMYEAIRMYSLDDYQYEIEWYQTGFFQVFVFIVAVALTVMQQYWATGAISAAATVGIITQTILSSALFTGIAPVFQDLLGDEGFLLVSVLAVAFGASMNLSGTGSLISATSPTTYSLVNAATQGISGFYNLRNEAKMEELGAELESIQEELDELYAADRQSRYDVGMVMSGVESDPYALLEPSTYVSRALIEPTIPTLVTVTTETFVEVNTHLDTSSTNIRLGN